MGSVQEVSDFDFSFDSRGSDFRPLPKGYRRSDVEMVSVNNAYRYTSLRDVLPPAQRAASPPPYSRRQSWEEIPIKNPLVQKGAWAYLRPMSAAPERGRRGLWAALKDKCRLENEVGCVAFLNAVVLRWIRGAVGGLFGKIDQTGNVDGDDDEHFDDNRS